MFGSNKGTIDYLTLYTMLQTLGNHHTCFIAKTKSLIQIAYKHDNNNDFEFQFMWGKAKNVKLIKIFWRKGKVQIRCCTTKIFSFLNTVIRKYFFGNSVDNSKLRCPTVWLVGVKIARSLIYLGFLVICKKNWDISI